MFQVESKSGLREWKDVKVVKIVNFATKILFIHPPGCHYNGKCGKSYLIYFSIFWIFFMLANMHELFVRRLKFYSFMVPSMAILEASFHVCLIIANFSASVDFIFLRRDTKIKIQMSLNKVEKLCFQLSGTPVKYEEKKITWTFITIMTLVFGCIFLTTYYMMWLFGLGINFYSLMTCNVFYISLLIFQLYLDLFRLEHLLKFMNSCMEDYMKVKVSVWTVYTRPRKNYFKRFVEIYSEIMDTFATMNYLYGFHFLMIILNVAIMVLHFSNFSLKILLSFLNVPINQFTLITDAFLIASFTVSIF